MNQSELDAIRERLVGLSVPSSLKVIEANRVVFHAHAEDDVLALLVEVRRLRDENANLLGALTTWQEVAQSNADKCPVCKQFGTPGKLSFHVEGTDER